MLRKLLRFVLPALLVTLSALASTTYEYTGQIFTTFRQSGSSQPGIPELGPFVYLAASIMLNAPLGGFDTADTTDVSAWWITVSPYSWSSVQGDYASIHLQTDGLGAIQFWDIEVQQKVGASFGYPQAATVNWQSPLAVGDSFDTIGSPGIDSAGNTSSGSWAIQNTPGVPEPGSLALVLPAVAALGLLRRQRRNR